MLQTVTDTKANQYWTLLPVEETSNDHSKNIWDQDMSAETEKAIDTILNYLVKNNLKPITTIEGRITEIAVKIIEELTPLIPDHLTNELQIMLDHICEWLTDYAAETSTHKMRVRFGFGEQQEVS